MLLVIVVVVLTVIGLLSVARIDALTQRVARHGRSALVLIILVLAALNLVQVLPPSAPAVPLGSQDAQTTNQGGDGKAQQLTKEEIITRFAEISYYSLNWTNSKWLGIRTLQNPNDVWIHQE